jgi:transposase InsO family protein
LEKRKINQKTDMKIIEKIKNIHKSSRMTYGYRRVYAELKEEMEDINHKKVARPMRENNILSKRRIRFKITTEAVKKAASINNILNRILLQMLRFFYVFSSKAHVSVNN